MSRKQLTMEELELKKEQLQEEIKSLESVKDAADTNGFDLITSQIKKEMEHDIAVEDWKSLKSNQKKVEAFCQVISYIESLDDILDEKRDELDDVVYDMEHYQLTLDDVQPVEQDGIICTGICLKNGDELETGDIYKTVLKDKETGESIDRYYLIKKSAESDDKFAILSSCEEGELLLNYPANVKLIDNATEYIGNIYIENSAQNKAIECLKIIADYQSQFNKNESADNNSTPKSTE